MSKNSFLAAGAIMTCLPFAALKAQTTLYWNTGNTVWSAPPSNFNWSTTPSSSPSVAWTQGATAEIVTANPTITVGGNTGITMAGLTVTAGAAFTAETGSSNPFLLINGSNGSSGSGDFTLGENNSADSNLRVVLGAYSGTAYDGKITVSAAASRLQLGVDNKADQGAGAFAGTGTSTRISLTAGGLTLAGGLAGKTAVIGELSGSGSVLLGNIASGNSGTRTLEINQATSTTFAGVVGATNPSRTDNTMALVKSGTGALTINGSAGSAWSAGTTVNDGTLILSGTFGSDGTGTNPIRQGNMTVADGATLGINGTFNTTGSAVLNVQNGGILDLGQAVIDATVTSPTTKGLSFAGTATIKFGLGTTSDLLTLVDSSMTGETFGGAGSIGFTFSDLGGTAVGATYDLISFGGVTQGIALDAFTLSPDSLGAGWDGIFSYGGDGNTLQFTVSSIPEPGSLALFGLALASVFLRRPHKGSPR